jgi:hypothetical protein
MKHLTLIVVHNWRAKLASLVVATIVWLVVRHGIAYAPSLPPPPLPPVPAETPG